MHNVLFTSRFVYDNQALNRRAEPCARCWKVLHYVLYENFCEVHGQQNYRLKSVHLHTAVFETLTRIEARAHARIYNSKHA